MASPAPAAGSAPSGQPPTPQQIPPHILELMKLEASKRGMTLEQFQAFQKKAIEEEAAKMGITPQEFVMRKQAEAQAAQAAQRKAIEEEAAKLGITPEEFVAKKQAEHQEMMRRQAAGGQPPAQGQAPPGQKMQQLDITKPVEAKPDALALAVFLRGQNLKTRTCIFNGQRKDMFKVKRAMRALHSPAYKKAQAKNPLLPKIENDTDARNALGTLPLSMLALRVSKKDPHEGHNHAKPKKEKRVKGLWDVKIEHKQEFEPMMHYIWIYEGSQWKNKMWAALAAIAVFAVVLFPLWPLFMRQGVWYLSVGAMGLIVAFFGLGIVRLILFCLTVFTIPPGLWIFPNLFEDVGFVDSFKPLYQWGETKKKPKKKKKAAEAGLAAAAEGIAGTAPVALNSTAPASATAVPTENGAAVSSSAEPTAGPLARRHATVEEAPEE